MESGGVLRSAVLTEKEQSQVHGGSVGYVDILGRFGFKSASEVWQTYCAITGRAAEHYGSAPCIVQQAKCRQPVLA